MNANSFEKGRAARAPGKAEQSVERPWPLITFDESTLIDKTGGDFAGFVESPEGRVFEDVMVDRRVRYDYERRGMTTITVTTDAVDREGEALSGPSAIARYDVLVQFDDIQKGATRSFVFSIAADNFPAKRLSTEEIRIIARRVHRVVVEQSSDLSESALQDEAQSLLEQNGWKPSDPEAGLEDVDR